MYEPPPGRLLLLSPRCEIEECRIYFIYVCAAAARAQRPPSVFFFILLRPKSARCVCAFTRRGSECVHGFKAIASDREYKTAELINVVVVGAGLLLLLLLTLEQ